ncbi:thioredoxin domain-containing protein [Candidatus Daviesbacteria bacterium]|nr:thioredoxin domain-containing protein [Candidatus Daviesbacteria bacterium]
MKFKNYFLSTPGSILIGSLLISISILASSGVLKINLPLSSLGEKTTPAASSATPSEILAKVATNIGLNGSKIKSCIDSEKYKPEISKDSSDASLVDANGTPTFFIGKSSSDGKINGVKVVGAQGFEVFKNAIDQQLSSTSGDQTFQVAVANGPVLGSKDAPVTMIEFSDYECPFCKSFFQSTLPQIKRDYVDTNKIKIVYRNLPLSFHEPWATFEAQAAECAREQGGDKTYYQYHDALFKATKSNGAGISL